MGYGQALLRSRIGQTNKIDGHINAYKAILWERRLSKKQTKNGGPEPGPLEQLVKPSK